MSFGLAQMTTTIDDTALMSHPLHFTLQQLLISSLGQSHSRRMRAEESCCFPQKAGGSNCELSTTKSLIPILHCVECWSPPR